MRVTLFYRLRTAADCWNCVCCHACRQTGHGANVATDIGCHLAAAGAPDKKAKMKKPSAGQLAAHARQKKHRAEWNEAKDPAKIEKRTTWPKFLEHLHASKLFKRANKLQR
jgi:hypothetical protein